jgi:hypothetical protein
MSDSGTDWYPISRFIDARQGSDYPNISGDLLRIPLLHVLLHLRAPSPLLSFVDSFSESRTWQQMP